ncbi:septal ring lytic transglycosylase RlpA family protein [Marivirga salinae]|uniref:Probable endolytic peptidoglycan transglycosylase RlpA n=1 Tax=Marivirga salinarum TaxID=3059078 RepID=A0AA49J9N0_9BACT|nr:septal ring lytic transglycosylase RlpA family protein [Marivirga sp. BDSF4-3]WKK77373.2 septal ring lytic transglycosylase RlpA family protein [Marivirga sp. BDSF4-3]
MLNKLIFTFFLFILSLGVSFAQIQKGTASFYADKFEGKQTASGEKYKHKKLTAAHKFLPFGTIVKVTNLENKESVEVRINDRGPFVEGRVIDLSRSAAEKLKFINQGLAEVQIEVIDAGDGRINSNRPVQTDQKIDNETYFEMKVKRKEPSGFGVQVGSFKGFDNMLKLSENIEKSYRANLFIEVKELNDTKVYALILGEYRNRKRADKLKAKMADRFPDAFVTRY